MTICSYTAPHLLGRHVVGGGPHVDLLVHVEAGDDEEDARAPRPARHQPAQPEDDRSLILLGIISRYLNI